MILGIQKEMFATHGLAQFPLKHGKGPSQEFRLPLTQKKPAAPGEPSWPATRCLREQGAWRRRVVWVLVICRVPPFSR